jgi:hypothetical protein
VIRRALIALAALALLAAPARAVEMPERCRVPTELLKVNAPLPRTAQRIKSGQPVTIVALGGASTLGTAAGAPQASYPERLLRVLSEAYPNIRFTVVNRGVARQSARQMLDRMPKETMQANPDLVLWEAGVHDAAQSLDLDDFTRTLQSGIELLRRSRIDPMLIDMQYGRLAVGLINFEPYLDSMHWVAEANGVLLFPRYEIMRYWSENGSITSGQAVGGAERAKLAAVSYDCLARQIAAAIQLGIE